MYLHTFWSYCGILLYTPMLQVNIFWNPQKTVIYLCNLFTYVFCVLSAGKIFYIMLVEAWLLLFQPISFKIKISLIVLLESCVVFYMIWFE